MAQTPQVSYLTSDHLGSARVITNQLGQITTRKDYLAFGDEASSSQRTSGLKYDSSETRKSYTGYEKDEESGLEFAQARYYNSAHGRFTSVDPLTASATIKNPQTFNRYSYVLNSPYKFTDPLGLISSSTGACGSECQNNEAIAGFGNSGGSNDSFQQDEDKPKKKKKKSTGNQDCACKTNQSKSKKSNKQPTQDKRKQTPVAPETPVQPETDNEPIKVDPVTTGNSEKIAKDVAKRLNEGYIEEQRLIEGALPQVGAEGLKSLVKELGETFNPQASAGTDSSIKIELPSPAPIIADLVNAGIDVGNAIIQNRIKTQTDVNLILLNADVDMQGNVNDDEIRPTLEQARARGIELHKNAVKRMK